MTDMTKFLLYFRSNKFTVISHTKKAFLMIKLGYEEDRNRFCFFLKEGNKLSCFGYKTIIFANNSSPFILNFIIKHHANQFPSDYCSEVLPNNLYVDNLLLTANHQDKLGFEAGFDLRSWTSNNPMLRERMISDNKYIEHESPYEKLLGYKYSTKTDYSSCLEPYLIMTQIQKEVFYVKHPNCLTLLAFIYLLQWEVKFSRESWGCTWAKKRIERKANRLFLGAEIAAR